MKILNTIKNFAESNIPKSSTVEESGKIEQANKDFKTKEGKLIQQAKVAALSKALGPVTEMGTEAVSAFLKTKEGKKVMMQIAKPLLKKYWWAIAGIATFEVIGILATIKFSLSKR